MTAHTNELIRPDVEVRFVLFENLGRNKRFGSVEPDVSLRQVGEVLDQYSEATWSYMVKRISAYGGCLGGQRRRRTWQPAKSSGESATDIDPEMSEWGNPPRKRYPMLNL